MASASYMDYSSVLAEKHHAHHTGNSDTAVAKLTASFKIGLPAMFGLAVLLQSAPPAIGKIDEP